MMKMMMDEMMRMIEMMMMITMWFCNNQSVKEAKGKAGGNPSRPEQTMGRAQHGKTEYKYSYRYKYKYKKLAELNMAKRNTNTLVSRQDIQFFLH